MDEFKPGDPIMVIGGNSKRLRGLVGYVLNEDSINGHIPTMLVTLTGRIRKVYAYPSNLKKLEK